MPCSRAIGDTAAAWRSGFPRPRRRTRCLHCFTIGNFVDEFERLPYPSIGPLTTTLRRVAFERLHRLLADRKGRTRAFVAWLDGQPVGAIELFHGTESAGVHGLSVLDRYQGRGIASALLEEGCREAGNEGFDHVALLATTEGQRLYQRRGFVEVGRFGYWYRSFQR